MRGRRESCRRQGIISGCQRCSADVLALELKLMAESVGDGLEDCDSLFGDFRADAVAGEDGQVQEHERNLCNWEIL